MTGWDVHQWGSRKIALWMMKVGVHHDAAKYIADDVRVVSLSSLFFYFPCSFRTPSKVVMYLAQTYR